MWTYHCYDTGQPINLWRAWYDAQNGAVRGRHDVVFEFLESRSVWRMPHAQALKGKPLKGLIEVRVGAGVEWRVLGYHSPGYSHTVVSVCNHKGKVYSPKNALPTAAGLMNAIKAGQKRTRPCARPR